MQSFTIFKYQVAAALLVSHSMAVAEENKDLPLKTILDTISPSGNPSWVDDKNATILDIFGEVAKDILTNKMIPPTEENCDWDWMHLRCEPYCDCSYQFLWGDYHLGRSCRARSTSKMHEFDREDPATLNACDSPPDTILYKGMKKIGKGVGFMWTTISLKRRAENARNDLCDSLDLEDSYLKDDERNGKGGSKKAVFEMPIRALRKSLHCNEMKMKSNLPVKKDGESDQLKDDT